MIAVVACVLAAWGFTADSAEAAYEGVASCAGSTCHGRSEGDGKIVRQDELVHWQDPASQGGAHSRAYAVLAGPRGAQIAASLGLGPATSAPACLGCHSTAAPAGQRGERFQQAEGVGCESCHGEATRWIATHFAVPATHEANIAQGMKRLESPAVRAGVCLDCHFGSAGSGQFVSHRMMAAGHPRVAFELDLFSSLQQHWDEDADYVQRKGRTDSVRMWAVGQALAVQRSTSLFAQPGLGTQGLFPEFYFFDCHSCHRTIDDRAERKLTFQVNAERPIPFGTPPYNDENIIMLSAVAKALAPGHAVAFDNAARSFHAAMGKGRSDAIAAGGRLSAAAGALANALSAGTYGGDSAFTVVSTISSQAISPRFTDYTGSQQAVMAVDTMLNALVKQGRVTVGAAAGIRGHINRAYDAVKAPNSYNPGAFRASLGEAARAIGTLR